MGGDLPVMGHIGLCHGVYLPQDSFRFLESIVKLFRKWWPLWDAWGLTESISMLLQYSIQSNLQYPTSSFVSRGEMHFSGTARLPDQLCTNERRKEGERALAGVTWWLYWRSWCLFQAKSCLERWPVTCYSTAQSQTWPAQNTVG